MMPNYLKNGERTCIGPMPVIHLKYDKFIRKILWKRCIGRWNGLWAVGFELWTFDFEILPLLRFSCNYKCEVQVPKTIVQIQSKIQYLDYAAAVILGASWD